MRTKSNIKIQNLNVMQPFLLVAGENGAPSVTGYILSVGFSRFAWITENAVPGSYLAVIFPILDDDCKLNVSFYPPGTPWMAFVITGGELYHH